MTFAEARALLIGGGAMLDGGPEDYALRRAAERLQPAMGRRDMVALLQYVSGVPDEHVALHIGKHADVERFCRDLGMDDDHRDRTHRAIRSFKGLMREADIVPIVVEYLELRLPVQVPA